jgi:altronate hydrolase
MADADSVRLIIRLSAADNVVTARAELQPGTALPGEGVTTAQPIPAGHKVATRPIAKGEAVRKYDQIIGFASDDIAVGEHVHVHNVEMHDFERDYAFGVDAKPTAYFNNSEQATFQGFKRADGSIGTRNYIGVLTSVNCSATAARYIAEAITPAILAKYPNVDGVVALTHSTGCGMAGDGEGYANLQRVLWGMARHPNFAGVLMVGLGCEVNQIDFLLEAYGIERGPRFQTMNIQDAGGLRKTVEWGSGIIKEMLPEADKVGRSTCPASALTLALQCGGSDAYSGMTANPALGEAANLLVRHGGTAVLAETPEIYGAEHLLTRRAVSREVGEKLIERIRWWEDYTARNGGEMNNNPSPGNKRGGLTTILEKSLGAAAKGGTTNLTGVFRYGEVIDTKGFVFMDSPGYDPASITGEVAGGSNVVCFTTGRGSVYGCKPAPSLKLATNTPMYNRMSDDMDINCGAVIDEGLSIEAMGERIFNRILEVASGSKTKSEEQGMGDNEFIPWQIGAVM